VSEKDINKISHKELVVVGDHWLKKRGAGVTMREIGAYTYNNENPDVIGWVSSHSVLIECKVSRADFLSDKKKRFRANPDIGMGDFRIYLCPTGIINPNDLPENWGLLWYDGNKTKKICGISKSYNITTWSRDVKKFTKCRRSEASMLYSGCRRMVIQGKFDGIYEKQDIVQS